MHDEVCVLLCLQELLPSIPFFFLVLVCSHLNFPLIIIFLKNVNDVLQLFTSF
uniref:Uncharacterized protein n=1 Tax=Arundo donax TaxID=35708 RepID=A0A0A8ZXN1_ARUDO